MSVWSTLSVLYEENIFVHFFPILVNIFPILQNIFPILYLFHIFCQYVLFSIIFFQVTIVFFFFIFI